MAKHHSRPHGDHQSLAIAAHKVLTDYKRQLTEASEEVRQDYEKQMLDNNRDYWLLTLAASTQVFFEMTGSRSKAEKFCERLNEKLRQYRADETPTADIIKEVERLTDICLSVENQN